MMTLRAFGPGWPASLNPRYLSAEDLRLTLERFGGNKTRAAHELGIAVNTLKARMKALGVKG